MAQQRALVESEPKKWTQEQRDAGLDKAARRLAVQLDSWRDQERTYSVYMAALSNLLTTRAQTISTATGSPRKI